MMRRIGVMGGMFDPVHRGHLAAALAAVEQLGLERLHLLPCATPNHRDLATASSEHRLAMLDLVSKAHPKLLVDDRELRRTGISYTVDSLAELHQELPDVSLVFVQGWDSFLSLPGWHRWQSLFDHAHLCAVSRPGVVWPPRSEDANNRLLRELLSARGADSPETLFRRPVGGIYVLDGVNIDISSTDLRCRLREGADTSDWLEPPVRAYIAHHGLY